VNNQVSPIPPSAVAPPPKTSGLAITSLVLGIVGITCIFPVFGAILAIIFGVLALNKINKSGGRITGQGQAIAGIVLGGVGLVMVPIMLAMLLPALNNAREHARRAQCMSNLKGIGLGLAMYAEEHDGAIPRRFEDLNKYITSDRIYVCPSARDSTVPSYEIVLGGKKWNSPESIDSIVLTEPLADHRVGRNSLYGDGRVEFKSER
jgi:hypothetical protein